MSFYYNSEDEGIPFSQTLKYDKPIGQWMVRPRANGLPMTSPVQRDPPAGDASSISSLEESPPDKPPTKPSPKPVPKKKGMAGKRKAEGDNGPEKKRRPTGMTVKEMVRQQREESPESVSFDAVTNNRNQTKTLRKKYMKETYKGE